jgi:hypothetical protein
VVDIAAFYLLGGIRKPVTFGIDYFNANPNYPLAIIGW